MADQDTAIRAGESRFPPTAWTLLGSLRDPRDPAVRECLNRMIETYWRPIYKYVRIAWKRSNEDAKDLTQSFFVHLLEGNLLATADPERGNFRKFLLSALRNFLSNDARDARAVKRGGGRLVLSMDGDADQGWPTDPADPQDAFETQWAREVLERSIDRLQERCRPDVFAAFRRFHLEETSVREIAGELGATEAQVGHFLQDARAELRKLVTEEIRRYVHDDSEVARELDTLFKGWR